MSDLTFAPFTLGQLKKRLGRQPKSATLVPSLLRGLLKFEKDDLKKAAQKIRDTHVKQIGLGIDAHGKPFKRYSNRYRRDKAGRKFKNQVSVQIAPPNLKLTGSMLKNFQVMKTSTSGEISIEYGVKNSEDGRKLVENNKTRVIAGGNRVGPMVQNEVVDMFAKNVQKNLKKISRQRLNIEM